MKTHCKHGHEFSKENTHINKDGSFICRKCRAIRAIHFRKSHPEKKVEKRNYMKDYQKTYYKRNQARIAESIKSWNTRELKNGFAHLKFVDGEMVVTWLKLAPKDYIVLNGGLKIENTSDNLLMEVELPRKYTVSIMTLTQDNK